MSGEEVEDLRLQQGRSADQEFQLGDLGAFDQNDLVRLRSRIMSTSPVGEKVRSLFSGP